MKQELKNKLTDILKNDNDVNNFVKAVKIHREYTGSSLKDAKCEVEKLQNDIWQNSPEMSIEHETPNSFRLKNRNGTLNVLIRVHENGSMNIETGLSGALAVLPISVSSVTVKNTI